MPEKSEHAEENKKAEQIRTDIDKQIGKFSSNAVEQHNTVFRQMATNLILVAGIFLALAANFGKDLGNSSNAVKILNLVLITLLIISIFFGIVQHYFESQFFKRLALGRSQIRKEYSGSSVEDLNKLIGAMAQFEKTIGRSTPRWPTTVQLCCLCLAMIAIPVVVGFEMYGI